jgi:hypothetical protein
MNYELTSVSSATPKMRASVNDTVQLWYTKCLYRWDQTTLKARVKKKGTRQDGTEQNSECKIGLSKIE